MPARIFQRSGPAFESVNKPAAELFKPVLPEENREPPSPIDAVLSEIDAEAAARSLTAVTGQAFKPAVTADPPPPEMPAASADAIPNLGNLIPGAPRFAMPSDRREPAVPGLRTDFAHHPLPQDQQTGFPAANDTKRRSFARRLLQVAVWAVAGWLAVVLLMMAAYRFVNPPASTLMLQQWLLGQRVVNTWVPIERISPSVIRAVIASEDSRFCEHHGIDFEALAGAVSDAGSGAARGASTISMQVVKNLFLWSSRSYVRKAVELPLTFVMETLWPKRRIMEVYLNIAEWGPGIFGIEAAAQARFHKPALNLSAGEASRLAVALPNPRLRNPAKPGPGMQRLARIVQMRMRLAPASQTSCVLPRRRN
jgi:monofunctional biosynthetic peptidoglycan transglycosylase